jgi:hypothetical protein
MYGDDTWLKLFPGMFDRADGTTSFFVSVSCNLASTKKCSVWDRTELSRRILLK